MKGPCCYGNTSALVEYLCGFIDMRATGFYAIGVRVRLRGDIMLVCVRVYMCWSHTCEHVCKQPAALTWIAPVKTLCLLLIQTQHGSLRFFLCFFLRLSYQSCVCQWNIFFVITSTNEVMFSVRLPLAAYPPQFWTNHPVVNSYLFFELAVASTDYILRFIGQRSGKFPKFQRVLFVKIGAEFQTIIFLP